MVCLSDNDSNLFFRDLLEELLPFIKEANDKKADKVKQRRKRDLMRSQLARIFELMAENKILAQM